jgi:uncharacterized protein (UPF0147 family)
MSDASKINSKQFIQNIEQKKQEEAKKDIEDVINKLQNQSLTAVQAKYEIAKLNAISQDLQINTDIKDKINDVINKLEQTMPEIKDLLAEELLKALEETQVGFTGEGISAAWNNNDNMGMLSSENYDQYKIDGNSTLSTYL